MPISKERMKLYPGGSIRSPEWLCIREGILERAGHKCEFCNVPDRVVVARGQDSDEATYMLEDGQTFCADTGEFLRYSRGSEYDYKSMVKIILTIMHLDHDPTNNDPSNLKAGCQRCHNRYDAAYRKKNAARSRRQAGGQSDMFENDAA